jgi:hypothetical protein
MIVPAPGRFSRAISSLPPAPQSLQLETPVEHDAVCPENVALARRPDLVVLVAWYMTGRHGDPEPWIDRYYVVGIRTYSENGTTKHDPMIVVNGHLETVRTAQAKNLIPAHAHTQVLERKPHDDYFAHEIDEALEALSDKAAKAYAAGLARGEEPGSNFHKGKGPFDKFGSTN